MKKTNILELEQHYSRSLVVFHNFYPFCYKYIYKQTDTGHNIDFILEYLKNLLKLKKFEPETQDLLAEITHGLKQPQKQLPSKLFYDKKGSSLFDQICGLDEYYLTRTEIAIMNDNIEEIADALGEHCLLIELGSGSSKKIRLLLIILIQTGGKNAIIYYPMI